MFETLLTKVAILLCMCMGMGSAGAYCGRNLRVTLGMFFLLFILLLGGLFAIFAAAHASPVAGAAVLAGWTFLLGLFMGPAVQAYSEELGWQSVFLAFVGTTGVMAACGGIGMFSGINFSGLGPILGVGLWGLIIFGVIAIFVRMSREVNIGYSLMGMIIFAGYFLYDFFRLSKSENTWEAAIQLTTAIYLDWVNFFFDLLRLMSLLNSHK